MVWWVSRFNIDLGYNFSLDNDYKTFEYNDFNATFSINNFVTKFNFIEETGETGDTNTLASSLEYKFDEKNSFRFQTRRNRKLNLTEYYDLVYEYKNDCLTAGIKYKKSYYADGDLQPTENLLFTISLFPLTTYEYNAEDLTFPYFAIMSLSRDEIVFLLALTTKSASFQLMDL